MTESFDRFQRSHQAWGEAKKSRPSNKIGLFFEPEQQKSDTITEERKKNSQAEDERRKKLYNTRCVWPDDVCGPLAPALF